jgi:Raf kinase inhibitor-like YbhB/YbcL family protein
MRRMLLRLAPLAAVLAAPAMAAMTLSSADLQPGATLAPAQIYPRCGGDNISPQLSWSGAPAGTQSYVLTMIDTSVQPAQWSHWVIVDIPTSTTSFARGLKTLPGSAKQIPSNFGDPYYDGPCPPDGSGTHRYEITLWALPTPTFAVVPDMKATELTEALNKVALGRASLVGVVSR